MTLQTSIVKMLDKFMYFREYILPRWTEKCYTQFLFISTFNVTFDILEKWFPLRGERPHSLKLFCMYDKRFEISKTK